MDIATLAVLGAAFVISQQKGATVAPPPTTAGPAPDAGNNLLGDIATISREVREWWEVFSDSMPPASQPEWVMGE